MTVIEKVMKTVNQNVGQIVTTSDFNIPKKNKKALYSYLSMGRKNGVLEHSDFGKYKVLVSTKNTKVFLVEGYSPNAEHIQRTGKTKEKIKKYISDNLLDIANLPYGTGKRIAEELNTSPANIQKHLRDIKSKMKIVTMKPVKRVETPTEDPTYDSIVNAGFLSHCPVREGAAVNLIEDLFRDKLPKGGRAILTGTPTPITAAKPDNNRLKKKLFFHELKLADTMKTTSDIFKIIVGNVVDAKKAEAKVNLWKYFMYNIEDIHSEAIVRDSFCRMITTEVEQNSLCKVVLLTSGAWVSSKTTEKKYGNLDFNFKSPSEYLTRTYPNLHIITMTITDHFVFKVRHLHNCQDFEYNPYGVKDGSL